MGRIDDAVRSYYESEGWVWIQFPGLSHRTGHGIALMGMNPAYLVHGDGTLLQSGDVFLRRAGNLHSGGVRLRLEDCWHMTASGPALFTPFAKSLADPIERCGAPVGPSRATPRRPPVAHRGHNLRSAPTSARFG